MRGPAANTPISLFCSLMDSFGLFPDSFRFVPDSHSRSPTPDSSSVHPLHLILSLLTPRGLGDKGGILSRIRFERTAAQAAQVPGG